jgi:hypothetical protein
MEPEWMKNVPSNLICDTYYAFFIIYVIIFGLTLVSMAYTYFYLKGMSPVQKIGMLALNGLVSVVAVTLVMFMYLMCDRALIAPQMAAAAAAENNRQQ